MLGAENDWGSSEERPAQVSKSKTGLENQKQIQRLAKLTKNKVKNVAIGRTS